MGYTTDFTGSIKFDRPLTTEHADYLRKLNDTRRMKRDVKKLMEKHNGELGYPSKTAPSNTPEEIYGVEGEFFVGGGGFGGQDHDDTILDFNRSSSTQPGLWCGWTITEDNTALEWDGGEKFYNYVEWLEYMMKNFFIKWGYRLNGEIEWQGEDNEDIGKIVIINNLVKIYDGYVTQSFKERI